MEYNKFQINSIILIINRLLVLFELEIGAGNVTQISELSV